MPKRAFFDCAIQVVALHTHLIFVRRVFLRQYKNFLLELFALPSYNIIAGNALMLGKTYKKTIKHQSRKRGTSHDINN